MALCTTETMVAQAGSCSQLLQTLSLSWASLVAQMVKNLPAMQETQVQSLGWEDILKNEMATHSSIPSIQYSCLENPTDRGAWRAIVHRVAKSWTRLTWLSVHACVSILLVHWHSILSTVYSQYIYVSVYIDTVYNNTVYYYWCKFM